MISPGIAGLLVKANPVGSNSLSRNIQHGACEHHIDGDAKSSNRYPFVIAAFQIMLIASLMMASIAELEPRLRDDELSDDGADRLLLES